MFGNDALKEAVGLIEKIEGRYHVATAVETVESLQGESPEAAVKRKAERWDVQGVYVLIDKKDHKFEMVATPSLSRALPRNRLAKVQRAFLDRFTKREFDEGLRAGLRALDEVLAEAKADGSLPDLSARRPAEGAFVSDVSAGREPNELVIRNQVRLTLAGARRIIAGPRGRPPR
jgi:uncharacterized membrane protein YgcG